MGRREEHEKTGRLENALYIHIDISGDYPSLKSRLNYRRMSGRKEMPTEVGSLMEWSGDSPVKYVRKEGYALFVCGCNSGEQYKTAFGLQ
jgi:hypothetical protein